MNQACFSKNANLHEQNQHASYIRPLKNDFVLMKSLPKKIAKITLLCLLFTGCKKNYVISNKQALLFQYDYINYAWGYKHNGFIIDSEGNVLKYNNPENWNFHESDSTLSEAQISENIMMCTRTGIKISDEELHKYSSHIKNIASSKVTALKNVAADAGSAEYLCYQFSEKTKTYSCYIIKMEGNFRCENLNFYSKKVVEWMKDINIRISGN